MKSTDLRIGNYVHGPMNEKHIHTEANIQRALRNKYHGTSKYVVENIYIFNHDWESDIFALKTNGYCYEVEIKISKADFFADLKKVKKHSILSTGKYNEGHGMRDHKFRPNKFYYCCPKGLIDVQDVPEYAGLLEVQEWGSCIEEIKKAPFIHK